MLEFTLYSGRENNLLRLKSYSKLYNLLISFRSTWRYHHCIRVSNYVAIMAANMGMSKNDIRAVELAGLMHDVGLSAINDQILDKRTKLSQEEYAYIKFHPVIGMWLLDYYGLSEGIVKAVLQHHESFDGSGYPVGLKGEHINLYARLLSLAEYFDTVTSDTPYKKASSLDEAIREIQALSGKKFDPRIVNVMMDSDEISNFCLHRENIQTNDSRDVFNLDKTLTL